MFHLVVESPPHSDERPLPAWLKLLKRILPAANPDFDSKIRNVQHWWIEVNDRGEPQREIGFDQNGQALMAMPLGENYGFWTDASVTFDAGAHENIDATVFERQWLSVQALHTAS